jgi:hypothetical protein
MSSTVTVGGPTRVKLGIRFPRTMAYSFPPSPTVGQTYTSNGKTWKWNGVQWLATAVTSPTSSPVFVSVSPPPNPVGGSLWFDSNTSNLNIWYTDLNGGQWISVVPYADDTVTQNGGIFEGPVYAEYEIPNNPLALVNIQWVNSNLAVYLKQQQFVKGGDGVALSADGNIVSIDAGLVT